NIQQMLQFNIPGMRAVPTSPAEVIANPVLGDSTQSMVQGLHAHLTPAPEGFETHVDSDAVPKRGEPGVVDLQDDSRLYDGTVLFAQGLSQSEDKVFVL